MIKKITLCLLVCFSFISFLHAQDANVPFTGIRNSVAVADLQANTLAADENNTGEMMLTSICDSLLTTMAGGNGHRGNMFDVTALTQLKVTKFDIHLDSFKVSNISVYYHLGTYMGTENNPAAWTLAGHKDSVRAKPPHQLTPLAIPVNVTIPAGVTCAFYITSSVSTKNLNYTNGTNLGSAYQQDANLIIYEGCAIEYPFSGTPFTSRVWNGRIRYCLIPTGIDEATNQIIQTTASPNPFSDYTVISIPGNPPSNYTLKIYDLIGNIVSEIKGIYSNEVKIEKGNLSGGMYFYRLWNKNEIKSTGKLIIE